MSLEPPTQRAIAQHAGTDPMMISQVLRALGAKGLIGRDVDPHEPSPTSDPAPPRRRTRTPNPCAQATTRAMSNVLVLPLLSAWMRMK